MRAKLVTLVVLVAVLGIGSLLLVLLGGDEEAGGAQNIIVEQATTPDGLVEVLVTVPDEINVPETANGQTTVRFECVDAQGEAVLGSQQQWPLLSDGDPPAPHVHQPASPEEIARLSECRFPETSPVLEGRVGLAR